MNFSIHQPASAPWTMKKQTFASIGRSARGCLSGALPWRVLAFVTLMLALAGPAWASGDVGRVSRVQGRVTARGAASPHEVSLDDAVLAGETLVTGDKARAELTMDDGSVVTLSENTEFTVTVFDLAKARARFELLRGAFRTATGTITQAMAPDFEVKTPLATIGIRGTDFWGGFFSAANFGVFMVSGREVVIRNQAGSQVITSPGQGVTVRGAGTAPEAPVIWNESKVQRAIKTVSFR
jgi:hypothetical protein